MEDTIKEIEVIKKEIKDEETNEVIKETDAIKIVYEPKVVEITKEEILERLKLATEQRDVFQAEIDKYTEMLNNFK